MRLKFEAFDGRSYNCVDVIDEDSDKIVGSIQSRGVGFGNTGGIDISLFDGKYEVRVNRFEEAWGFVKGVEVVINRISSVDDGRAALERKIYELQHLRSKVLAG